MDAQVPQLTLHILELAFRDPTNHRWKFQPLVSWLNPWRGNPWIQRTDGILAASQVMLVVKNLPTNVEDITDTGWIPGSGRSPGGRHSNPFQYSCLENPIDRGTFWATVHSTARSWLWLKHLITQLCIYWEVATCKGTWAVHTALFKGHLGRERETERLSVSISFYPKFWEIALIFIFQCF